MNIHAFEGYIFDLDGTLLDSMEIWQKIYAAPFREVGLSMPKNLLEKINHLSLADSAKYTVQNTSIHLSAADLAAKWLSAWALPPPRPRAFLNRAWNAKALPNFS